MSWFKKAKKTISVHWAFALLCIAFGAAAIWLATGWYRYQLNPDATSYFTIAAKYAHGDFRHALNGYWGPLISWLLVPAVWLHANMIIAAKLINGLAGLAILISLYAFLDRRGVSRVINWLVAAVAAALLIKAVAFSVTPDILAALFTLLFAFSFCNWLGLPRLKLGIVVGLLGALMYFSKGFNFYLFVSVVGLCALCQWYKSRNFKLIFRRYLPIGLSFAVLVLPFILLLSFKYHSLTINTAGGFDHAVYGPVAQGVSPLKVSGPLAPPNSSAQSAWEDPTGTTKLVPGYQWSPFDSGKDFGYFSGSVFGHNLNTTLDVIGQFGTFVAAGLVILVIGSLSAGLFRREYRLFLLIALITAFGYSLVYTEARYLLAISLLAAAGLGLWIDSLRRAKFLNHLQLVALALIVSGLSFLSTGQSLASERGAGQSDYQIALALRTSLPEGSHIIADDTVAYRLCYYLNLRCYGVLTPPLQNQDNYYQLLKKFDIKYYVEYHPTSVDQQRQQFINQHLTKLYDYSSGNHSAVVYYLN